VLAQLSWALSIAGWIRVLCALLTCHQDYAIVIVRQGKGLRCAGDGLGFDRRVGLNGQAPAHAILAIDQLLNGGGGHPRLDLDEECVRVQHAELL
jgi:hypothetical protein